MTHLREQLATVEDQLALNPRWVTLREFVDKFLAGDIETNQWVREHADEFEGMYDELGTIEADARLLRGRILESELRD